MVTCSRPGGPTTSSLASSAPAGNWGGRRGSGNRWRGGTPARRKDSRPPLSGQGHGYDVAQGHLAVTSEPESTVQSAQLRVFIGIVLFEQIWDIFAFQF